MPAPANERTTAKSLARTSEQTPPAKRAPSREKRVNVASWHDIAVKFQLEELMLKLGRERGRKVTLNELTAEAYNDIFKKYGLPEIAQERAQ